MFLIVSLFLPSKDSLKALKTLDNSSLDALSTPNHYHHINNPLPLSGNIGLQNAIHSSPSFAHKWIGVHSSLDIPSNRQFNKSLKIPTHHIPVTLTPQQLHDHYHLFCKQILWKTFHYQFPSKQTFERQAWNQYISVNQAFATAIVSNYSPGDIIWINDYHLMLVPAMVRKLLPQASIGFFLHIPFPSSEIFRCLFVRNEILLGILGADLIGFQTYSFMRHFLMTCTRLLSFESTPKGIQLENTIVSVGIFPIGIDILSLNEKRNDPKVPEIIASLLEKYSGKKIVIGRDKNDYVKGVRCKLLSFERFLYLHPEWVGKVVLIQVALSTTEANESEGSVSDVVAHINSKFGFIGYSPVVYLQQDISFSHYLALLTIADACLITSIRDGMNLTSHEYVVCQTGKHSPLIMSEFAGTYGSFGCALRVNPWDKQEVAECIYEALTMSEEERFSRWKELYRNVSSNTAQSFVENFSKEIVRVHDDLMRNTSSQIPQLVMNDVVFNFASSQRRLIVVDEEGTLWNALTPYQSMENAQLSHIHNLLIDLCKDSRNLVYLVSGRRREFLKYYEDIPELGISAENGSFLMFSDRRNWVPILRKFDTSWKKNVNEIFEYYTDRTPGSYIEHKETSMVWHFGLADQSFAKWQAGECVNHIQNSLGSIYSIHTISKKKSVEVMPLNVSKGVALRRILEHHQGRKVSSYHSASTSTTPSTTPKTNKYLRENTVDIDCASPQSAEQSPVKTSGVSGQRDDRQDEYMFEYLSREETHARTHSGSESLSSEAINITNEEDHVADLLLEHSRLPLSHASIWTCTVGVKSSAAKWYLSGINDVLELLQKLKSARCSYCQLNQLNCTKEIPCLACKSLNIPCRKSSSKWIVPRDDVQVLFNKATKHTGQVSTHSTLEYKETHNRNVKVQYGRLFKAWDELSGNRLNISPIAITNAPNPIKQLEYEPWKRFPFINHPLEPLDVEMMKTWSNNASIDYSRMEATRFELPSTDMLNDILVYACEYFSFDDVKHITGTGLIAIGILMQELKREREAQIKGLGLSNEQVALAPTRNDFI